AGVREALAERGRQGPRPGRIVGAVEHEESSLVAEYLKASRPPRPGESRADRGFGRAELAPGADREERVGRLEGAGHAELETGQGPARAGAGDPLAVEPALLYPPRQGPALAA